MNQTPPVSAGHWAPVPPDPARIPIAGKVLLMIIGMFVAGVFAVAIVTGPTEATGPTGATGGHTVTYKVEGTTDMASITYENGSGDSSQQSDVDVPLTRKSDGGEGIVLRGMERGDFLYISAQNSRDRGSVTCIIEVDGVVVKTNTSRGGYTIATCSGRL